MTDYAGTGVTEGPFSISPGSSEVYQDPAASTGSASGSVQIQNQSSSTLSVVSAGAAYTVPAFQATTVPTTGNGDPVTITPQGGTTGGSVTLIWLLSGQTPPIPDGILSTPASTTTEGPNFSGRITSTQTIAETITLPASAGNDLVEVSFDTTLHSGTYTAGDVTLELVGTSGIVYLSTALPAVGEPYSFAVAVPSSEGSIELTIAGVSGMTETVDISSGLVSVVAGQQAPADVVEIGGLSSFYETGIASGTTVGILDAPPSGCAWRLHSISCNQLGFTGNLNLKSNFSGQVYACLGIGNPTQLLGGRLVVTELDIDNNTDKTMGIELGYDLVSLPAIT